MVPGTSRRFRIDASPRMENIHRERYKQRIFRHVAWLPTLLDSAILLAELEESLRA